MEFYEFRFEFFVFGFFLGGCRDGVVVVLSVGGDFSRVRVCLLGYKVSGGKEFL